MPAENSDGRRQRLEEGKKIKGSTSKLKCMQYWVWNEALKKWKDSPQRSPDLEYLLNFMVWKCSRWPTLHHEHLNVLQVSCPSATVTANRLRSPRLLRVSSCSTLGMWTLQSRLLRLPLILIRLSTGFTWGSWYSYPVSQEEFCKWKVCQPSRARHLYACDDGCQFFNVSQALCKEERIAGTPYPNYNFGLDLSVKWCYLVPVCRKNETLSDSKMR